MESIPNWFRWLIIAIATLILCACRSPLHDQTVQSILVRKSKKSTPTLPAARTDYNSYDEGSLLSKLSTNHPPGSLPMRDGNSLASYGGPAWASPQGQSLARGLDTRAIANLHRPNAGSLGKPAANCETPVIVKEGDRIRTYDPAMYSQNTKAPIYFHVNDPSIPAGTTGVRQTQAIQPEVGSPFLDDPELAPMVDAPPAAPVLDRSFSSNPIITNDQPITGNHAGEYVSPPTPIIDDQSVPLAPEYYQATPALPAPYDYLPQETVPVEIAPEDWATAPSETMNASYAQLAHRYPDEYICDGGDAAGQVRVAKDWTVSHLNPEDTVGHYDTLDWELEVEPSNRVCIYAPRFAAVRKVTSPFQNEKREQVLIEKKDLPAITQQQELVSNEFQQNQAAQRHLLLQPASGLQSNLPGVTGTHTQLVRIANHGLSVHEDFRVMKLGLHKQSEKPRLAEYAAKAVAWSHDVGVQVVVDGVAARTNISHKGIESVHTIGDNRPAKLRVVKTASVADALPGEEIEFTLRFDNIGHQPMGNVTIIDNLTTRLEYLDDTQECSLDANFVEDVNEVDSLILRWEIVEPIQPGKGGLVRFRCRLR